MLEELIARQRFSLNRMTRIVRQGDAALPDQQTLDRYVKFEEFLADNTLVLAEGLERVGIFRCEFLYDAETVMRKSIQRLRAEEFVPASERQSEALVLLIKARGDLRKAFSESPSAKECQKFDREQIQKLRNPKDEDEKAEMLASKLDELAEEERLVYATLGGLPCEQGSPSNLSANAPSSAGSAKSESESSESSSEGQQETSQQQPGQEEDPGEQQANREGAGDDQPPSGRRGGEGEEGTGESLDRQQLEQRQYEIVLDAYEVKRMMAGLDGMTELARNRMTRSTQRAEDVSGALARGDTDEARDAAGEASRLFKELARHAAGLSARDLAGKIGAARDLSADLAARQRELADRFRDDARPGAPSQGTTGKSDRGKSGADSQSESRTGENGQQSGQQGQGQGEGQGQGDNGQGESGRGRGTGDAGSGGSGGSGGSRFGDLAGDSGRLAEGGHTLQDILDALARDTEADGELVSKIAIVREHARLGALVRRMEAIQQRLGGFQIVGIEVETREVADRLELLAHELDAIHGAVVAPQLSQLIAMEKQAAVLRTRLLQLTSDAEISQWHLDAQTLLQALEKAGADSPAAGELREAMSDAGWGTSRSNWGWNYGASNLQDGYYYTAPWAYHHNLTLVVEDIQREARDLLLRDLMASGEEAVPPQYEKLVERYFEVLSHERESE